MLRSWLLGVFVIGLTGYLVVRSQFGQSGQEDMADAGTRVAAGSTLEEGPVQTGPEGVSNGVGRPGLPDPAPVSLAPRQGETAPGSVGGDPRDEGRSPTAAEDGSSEGSGDEGLQGTDASPGEDPAEVAEPWDPDEPLSFQFQRPGGGTAVDREQARREARDMIRLAQETESPVGVARYLTRALMSGGLEPEEDESIYQALLQVHRSGLLSSRNLDGCFVVEVKSGDNLWDIASQLEREGHPPISPGLIQYLNGMRSDRLNLGQKLKIPVDPLSIQVVKGRYRLHVFLGDILLRRFDIGLGRPEAPTPEGSFRVVEKTVNPAWDGPMGRIAFGEEGNPLGTRWLGFDGGDGYGIHGTWEPDSIRGNRSNGCIRMLNEEVETLFEWVPRGAKVLIVP